MRDFATQAGVQTEMRSVVMSALQKGKYISRATLLYSRETLVSGNIMFLSATQLHPPRHIFVVSAITFEGLKLRSSSLTNALLIQISRKSSIIDIVVPSKMAAGHFCQNNSTKKLRIDMK